MAPTASGGQPGWLRGVVKEVLSGDTLVIAAGGPNPDPLKPPPAEKRLTLGSLISPRMGRRDGSVRDEPYAWQSREFLRKLAVGQPCVFRIDYVLDTGARAFGTVFINDGKENLAVAVVAAGWAKVRAPGGQQSPRYEELAKAAGEAEQRGLGVWAPSREAAEESIRPAGEADGAALLATLGKGKPMACVVESVISGSSLRVTLLPSLQQAQVLVAGVQCPSMGRRPTPEAAAEGAEEKPAEPLAREAAQLAALRYLGRDANLILWGVSQFGVLVASVQQGDKDLGTELVKSGLGKVAEWSLNMMTTGAMRLREAERAARQARTGIWVNYVAPTGPGSSAKLSDEFEGTVSEVVSGDCLVVRDRASGVERRVNLSSIRAPRMGARDRAPEPWATEAKEFLRQRLIGKTVAIKLEYTRKVAPALGVEPPKPGEERVMTFGAVAIPDPSGAAEKAANIAEVLLSRGLAQVVKHRGDEERAGAYEALLAAEEQGKQGKKGQWGSKEPALPRTNDLSVPGSGTRAKQHLSFLQRAGKVAAVCEHVMSGHRVKLHIPSQGVTVAFSPASVRCPARAQAAQGGRAESEPFADEAFAFTRSHVLQRDCEVEVDGVDKAGTFLGTLRVGKLNLGVSLLEEGLAKLHATFDAARTPGGRELAAAQDKARKAKLRIWERDEPAAEAPEGEGSDAGGAQDRERVAVTVTDMRDCNAFYVQMAGEPRVSWIAEQLAGLGLDTTPAPSGLRLAPGDRVIARFSVDGQFYRAKVERAYMADPTAPQYDVLFEDFGNRERIKAGDVRSCPANISAVPPQAHLAQLAFVKAPELDAEYGLEAAQLLSELVGDGRRISAYVERRERVAAAPGAKGGWGTAAPLKLHLTMLGPDGSVEEGANAQLLAAGLARFLPPPTDGACATGATEAAAALQAVEEQARRRRRGIWEYGDVDEDEEDY